MKENKKRQRKNAETFQSVKEARAKGGKTAFRATFMENILLKKRDLESTLEHLMDGQREYDSQFSGGEFIDDLDRAQREISAESHYPLIERKVKELQKIDFLIDRMSKKKKFGLCEECGKSIPKERLLVIPEATLCVTCQREQEKMDSQRSVEPRTSPGFERQRDADWGHSSDLDTKGYLDMEIPIEGSSKMGIRGAGFPPSHPPLVQKLSPPGPFQGTEPLP